jgi:hypothetical protein
VIITFGTSIGGLGVFVLAMIMITVGLLITLGRSLGVICGANVGTTMTETLNFTALSIDGMFATLGYVLVVVTLTVLTKSSSAAIAITLIAATGGLLALDAVDRQH